MKPSLSILLLSALSSAAPALRAEMMLDRVIDAAKAKPAVEDLDLEIARSRLRMLEAMGRRRIDFSPQIGLLALTNPVALATSVGAGLLFQQGSASPLTILDARIEVAATEVSASLRRFQREVAVTRAYFDMALSQRAAREACSAMRQAETQRSQVQRELRLARITDAEVLLHEQLILDRTGDCRRAGRSVQIASAHLAGGAGIPADGLEVDEDSPSPSSLEYPLQPVDALVRVALAYRSEPSALRGRIAELRRQVEAARGPNPLQLSMRYSHAGQQGLFLNSNSSIAGSGFLPEISTRIPLKKNGELAAEKRLLLLKLDRLERGMEDMEQEMRTQITEIQVRFQSTRDELEIARKRLALSNERQKVATARYRAGLEAVTYLTAAEDAQRQSALELSKLEYTGRTTLATLLSVCGLRGQPVERQQLLIAVALPASTRR